MKRIILAGALLIHFFCVLAQEEVSVSFVNPSVTSGQLSERASTESFELIKVITRQEMDLLHAVTLNDVLLFELNINQLYTGTDGYRIDYQGLGSRNIRILQDGQPILPYSADFLDIGQISLEHIERIELVFWANGVRLGNSAISLTINLISMRSEQAFSGGFVKTWVGTQGNFHTSANGFLNYGRHHASITVGRNFMNGLAGSDSFRYETFKPTEQWHLRAHYYYQLGKNLEAGLYFGAFMQDMLNRGEPVPGTTRALDELVNTRRLNGGFYLKQHLSKVHTIDLHFGQSIFKKDLENRLMDLSTLEHWTIQSQNTLDSLDFVQSNIQAVLKKWNASQKFNYMAGAEINIQRDRRTSREGLDNKSVPQYEVYALAEYRPDRQFWLAGGLRSVYSPRYLSPLLPELKMRLRLSPSFDLMMGYSSAYRVPSFNELYYNYTDPQLSIEGNLNLRAERSNSIHTGFDLHLKRLRISTSMFSNDKQDAIQLLRVAGGPNSYAFINSGRIRTFGTQAMVSGAFGRYRFQFDATSTGINSAAHLLGQYFFYQQVKANVFAEFFDGALVLASMNKFTGENQDLRLNNDGEFEAFELGRYLMSDLAASVKPGKKDYILRLGLKNIFDVRTVQGAQFIVDFNSEPVVNNYLPGAIARGRTIFIQLEARW